MRGRNGEGRRGELRGWEEKADNRDHGGEGDGSIVETFLLAKFRKNLHVYFTS